MRFFLAVIFLLNLANSFDIKATGKPFLVQTGNKKKFCSFSAKAIVNFYKTSHIVFAKDYEVLQYCTLGELAADSMNVDIIFGTIKAIDALSEEVIDANLAFYLVESTLGYELAFKNLEDANEFMAKFGGRVTNLDEAYDVGYIKFSNNLKLENIIKEKRLYPMGKRIYEARCGEVLPYEYRYINDLKADLFKKCNNLDERKAQLATLYLWEVLKQGDTRAVSIEVGNKDRCPVCGMFVYKYPRWAAKIYIGEEYYVFDGVKDMMKYIHNPGEFGTKISNKDGFKFDKILVTDYYTQYAIDAKEAFYVTESDILGPMGHELIPFKKEEDARAFKLDHKGTAILKFDEITTALICSLDGAICE